MTRTRILSGRHHLPPCAGRVLGPLAGLALLAMGGCAGPAADPSAASAAPPPAYAPRREVHVVSDALNQKLDRMLAAPTQTRQ